MKIYKDFSKRAEGYMKKHPFYNSTVHALGGVAVGILLTHTCLDPHPVRWAAGLLGLSVLGHVYAGMRK